MAKTITNCGGMKPIPMVKKSAKKSAKGKGKKKGNA